MNTVLLSLGSNVGDRKFNLTAASNLIKDTLSNTKISEIYETEPWGKTDQYKFLNLCISGETSLKPKELLNLIKNIEKKIGRRQSEKWGPREIDIDILFYNQDTVDYPNLKIPHPEVQNRSFVLVPLSDIAPSFIHPTINKSIGELTKAIDISGVKKYVQKTQIMAILNATPDSFSDGGEINNKSKLDQRIKQIISEGADIIDVGGESTRPGYIPVDSQEEINRIVPVIVAIRKQSRSIPISIDTQKASVARTALETGANIINDISALNDPAMAKLTVDYGCPIILMRNIGIKNNLLEETNKQFEQIINKALDWGVKNEQIILDPGLGFGDLKSQNFNLLPGGNVKANLELTKNIISYSHGFPVLIGGSKKRFIGEMMNETDAKKRTSGSVELAVMAAKAGAYAVRVHDVAETKKAFIQLQG